MVSRNELRDRYRQVMHRIGEAAERAGRPADSVVCVAVTKYASPDQIRQIIEMGHQDLGESRVQQLHQRVGMAQEFLARRRMLGDDSPGDLPSHIRWHMIGHLQRNKVKPVLPLVKLVHSVDSLRLVEEAHTQAARADQEVEILLQVNISGEKSKYGIAPAAIPHLAEQIQTMVHLKLRGLMTMAPHAENPEESRVVFQRCAELFFEMRNAGRLGEAFNLLSMGMSNDYEVAIECGANIVRVGRGIFGEGEHE
ncbi:MAG: YggS family pyridoxal phosphate-dependent enzyme [Phycisphaeraceae bacterium]